MGDDGAASQFIFLNSDPKFEGLFVVPCERVPCIPKSETGVTAFSFTAVPRYNEKQLKLYNAKKLGILDRALAAEIREFVNKPGALKALSGAEARIVKAAFEAICCV